MFEVGSKPLVIYTEQASKWLTGGDKTHKPKIVTLANIAFRSWGQVPSFLLTGKYEFAPNDNSPVLPSCLSAAYVSLCFVNFAYFIICIHLPILSFTYPVGDHIPFVNFQ